MARTDPQVNFRIPSELNEQLKKSAELMGRSITAELVWRLQQSFELGGDLLMAEDMDEIGEAHRRYIVGVDQIVDSSMFRIEMHPDQELISGPLAPAIERLQLLISRARSQNDALRRTFDLIEIRYRRLLRVINSNLGRGDGD